MFFNMLATFSICWQPLAALASFGRDSKRGSQHEDADASFEKDKGSSLATTKNCPNQPAKGCEASSQQEPKVVSTTKEREQRERLPT